MAIVKSNKKFNLVNFSINKEEVDYSIEQAKDAVEKGEIISAVGDVITNDTSSRIKTAPIRKIEIFKNSVRLVTNQIIYNVVC